LYVSAIPTTHCERAEQGLLKTFGRVMPIGMTLCVVLAISSAINSPRAAIAWPAAAAFATAVVFTVPINLATGRWDITNPPTNWEQTRNRWEVFQGVRSWLLLIGFILECLATN
jgi:hypothetical protein